MPDIADRMSVVVWILPCLVRRECGCRGRDGEGEGEGEGEGGYHLPRSGVGRRMMSWLERHCHWGGEAAQASVQGHTACAVMPV